MTYVVTVASLSMLLQLHLCLLLCDKMPADASVVIIGQDEKMPIGGELDAFCKGLEGIVFIDAGVSNYNMGYFCFLSLSLTGL